MQEHKSIVVTYRPKRKIFFSLLVFFSIMLSFLVGRYLGGYEAAQIMTQKLDLDKRLRILQAELVEYEEQLSLMKLSSEVDNVALESARQQMVILQRQIYSRNEDLKLYRDLLQDNDSPSGVSISDFSLTLLDDDRIKYCWVVRQKQDEVKRLSLFADFKVEGRQVGTARSYKLSDLDQQVEKWPIKIEFKYFSIQQGVMELPEGFNPDNVIISLRYTWDKRSILRQEYDWTYED